MNPFAALFGELFPVTLTLIAVLALWKGIKIVPQNYAFIVERLGRYDRTLTGGLHFIIPFIDRISYKHSMKEVAVDVAAQSAITQDNVKLDIDGIVYIKIIDPVKASYGIEDMRFGIMQLAQTTMRSEIGKIGLDKTFEEREHLNVSIVRAINEAADAWGVQCLRYEIKDIQPPATILKAMELQVAAEREKRALILDSEGKRQAQINMAEAAKQEQVLHSEGEKFEQINIAEGEANAIRAVAHARAEGIRAIAEAIESKGGDSAVAQQIAEKYVEAFQAGMRQGTVIMLPTNTGDVNSIVTQALTTFNAIRSGDGGDVLRTKKVTTKGSKS